MHAAAAPISTPAEAATARARYNFNPGWLVLVGDPANAEAPAFDDSAWKPVTLPYAWNEDSAFRVSIHDLPTGVAWYRKHFSVPANSKGQRIFLEFEGIRMAGEVYLNGRSIGLHEDGITAFGFDITDVVLPGPAVNVLAVRTDNDWKYKERATGTPFHWNDTNFYANYGGINKNVWLHVMAPIHQTLPIYSLLKTTGTYIWASQFDLARNAATITAESQARNDGSTGKTVSYAVRIEDPQAHRTIAAMSGQEAVLAPGETHTFVAAAPVKELHFWSWGYGYLYDVVTTLSVGGQAIDSATTRTGFRETSFDHGMVTLNGRVLNVHGYGQRTTNEWPALGIDLPPWLSDFSNRLMVESNANAVRWMHVTPSRQDTDSADRVGLIESMPAGDAEGDSQGRQWEQRVEAMRDSIVYNRNDPSILFYESGNHGVSDAHVADMKAVRDQFDPHGGRALGSREELASSIAEYGGEMLYVDKSAGKPLWAQEYNRDEGARAFWDDDSPPFHKDSPLYNRNQDSAAIEDIVAWDDYFRVRPGTGNRVSAGGVNIIFSDSNTHFRGDNNYRRSGEVGPMRIPKDGYFAHQAMWNGWVDPEKPAIYILGHWNYAAGTVKPVYVVAADSARVELRLNGKVLGSIEASPFNFNESLAQPAGAKPVDAVRREPVVPPGQSNDFLFTFPNVAFAPGTLEAIAYDGADKPVANYELRTAAAPAAIRLTPHVGPTGLHADGSDLALIDVEVVDADGQRVPCADPMISFDLTGPAEWRGGIAEPPAGVNAMTFSNYILATTLPVENGINRVTLRTKPLGGTAPGAIVLKASSPGLASATLTLHSEPVAVSGGLSSYLPASGLQSYLDRGPTPKGSSVHITRTSLEVASTTAGSNADRAMLSHDDNETTSWSSDGQIANAWIEYTFSEPSAPTEMDIKLTAFRTRHYPLRVTLDGTTLYEGVTPTRLGYVTIPLQQGSPHPMSGSHLRIVLTGPAVDAAPSSAAPEITGAVDPAAITRNNRNILSIIETDIYK